MNTQNLPQVEKTGKVKGLILTLKGQPAGQTQAFDFYSRYFAPWVGVAEDPVTGTFRCGSWGGINSEEWEDNKQLFKCPSCDLQIA